MSNSHNGNQPQSNMTAVTSEGQSGQLNFSNTYGTLIEIDSLPEHASVDGIVYFNSHNPGKYLVKVTGSSIRAATVGFSPSNSGSANLIALANVINAAPRIRTLVFDEPAGGVFKFSGNIPLPDDLRIVFEEGNMWDSDNGVAQIMGGIIEAADTSQIFSTNIFVRPSSFAAGYTTVHHWGAKPDLTVDQSVAFQKALECVIAYPGPLYWNFPNNIPVSRTNRLLISLSGNYIVKNLYTVKWNGDPNDGQQHSNAYICFSLEGVIPSTDGVGGVVLVNDDPNSCTLAIQTGNNVLIKNITFRGCLKYLTLSGDTSLPVKYQTSDWLVSDSNAAVRNNRYSPYAAIAIDPFMYGIETTDRYPALADKYINPYGNGTSLLTIENCNFYKFNVAIMESSSGMPNGDNVSFKNGFSYNCRVFWACGNLQARANQIENLYIVGAVQFFVNTGEFGTQVGCAPEIKNCSLNGIKYLYYINGEFSGISFTGCYGENVWSFGKCTGLLPVTFDSCQFNLRLPNDSGNTTAPALLLAQGRGAFNFVGGKIEYGNNENIMSFPFDTPQVNFTGSTIKTSLPFQTRNNRFHKVNFEGVLLTNNWLAPIAISDNAHLAEDYIQSYYNKPFLPGSVITDYNFQSTYHSVGKKFSKEYIEDATVVVDSTDKNAGECRFNSSHPDAYKFGDAIFAEYPFSDPYGFYQYQSNEYSFGNPPSVPGTALGYVDRVVGSTVHIKFSAIAAAENAGTMCSLYIIRIPRMQVRGIGTTTSGSSVMTNVSLQDRVIPATGSHIRSTGLPAGTRVESVDTINVTVQDPAFPNDSTKTLNLTYYSIQLSRAAIASVTSAQFFDAEVRLKYDNYSTLYVGGQYDAFNLGFRIWYKEDEIFNVNPGLPTIRSWYCLKEGEMTANPALPPYVDQPAFVTVV